MEEQRAESPADALVRFLNSLIAQPTAPRSIEELRESVQAMGIDPERLVSRARERLARAQEEARLSWVTRARTALPEIRRRVHSTRSLVNLTRDELLRRVREAAEGIFGPPAREFAASFHKFDDLPDADLASLVEDIEVLRLLDGESKDERP